MTADRYAELCAAWRWNVPPSFNIADVCSRRWAADRTRFALYWEDEDGATAAYTFWDLETRANRLANALAALGVRRGDKVALILPQRPETVIAHFAVYKLGAIAVPLSFLFGPEALEYRLENSAAKVAFVDPQSLPNVTEVRGRLSHLAQVIGVAGARESFVTPFEALVDRGSRHFAPVETSAGDPALLIYTSGTTKLPKGALMPHACLLGNLPGFIHSHDGFPQQGDLFWSPADWAWTGGLMDALLPTLYFGQPIVGYRGRFDAERALRLHRALPGAERVPVPDGAEAHHEGVSSSARRVRRQPAQRDERRRSGRHHGLRLGARGARRHDQRNVRPDRDELHRRQLAHAVAGEAGLDGAPATRVTAYVSSTRPASPCLQAKLATSR